MDSYVITGNSLTVFPPSFCSLIHGLVAHAETQKWQSIRCEFVLCNTQWP